MSSRAWKAFEKHVAEVLGGERILRGSNFAASEPDVVSDTFVVDAKCYQRHAAITLYEQCHEKYQAMLDGRIFLLALRAKGSRRGNYYLIHEDDLLTLTQEAQ